MDSPRSPSSPGTEASDQIGKLQRALKGLRHLCTVLAWAYACIILIWVAVNLLAASPPWWLAVLNAIAPYLFLPLLVLGPLVLLIPRLPYQLAVLPPLIIFALLYGRLYVPARPVPSIEPDTSFSVLTFDVGDGHATPETAAVVLEAGLPDIVLLQSVSPDMADLLLAGVEDFYPYFVFDTNDAGGATGLAVISRFPIITLDSVLPQSPDLRVQLLQITVHGHTVWVYNTEARSVESVLQDDGDAPVAQRIKRGMESERSMAQRLTLDVRSRDGAVLLAGALSSPPSGPLPSALQQETDLEDAHRIIGWGLGHTFPVPAAQISGVSLPARLLRTDAIYYSHPLVPLRSRTIESHGGSDHLPVLACFGWSR